MPRDTEETLWDRLSRSWQSPPPPPPRHEEAGPPAEPARWMPNPPVGAFLR